MKAAERREREATARRLARERLSGLFADDDVHLDYDCKVSLDRHGTGAFVNVWIHVDTAPLTGPKTKIVNGVTLYLVESGPLRGKWVSIPEG